MDFVFYNTLTREKEPLQTRGKNTINIFVCGPTVYDYAHIGHGRVFVTFDAIVKTLRNAGYSVHYIQNITDVDDKIINRANEQNISAKELAGKFEEEYITDMRSLYIDAPDEYPRASDHITEIQDQVQRLLKNGMAYHTSTGIYFEITRFPSYGKLSHQNLNAMQTAERIDPDPEKHNPRDFSLWKKSKPGEPQWPSPWGQGRPGWHIEDTAIAEKYFGQQYDMHGGALDLIFPHHECEIAQMEAISGKEPYVTLWLHSGFLNVRGEKMSKSLGNIIPIRDLLANYPAETFRLMVFQAHYRAPIDYDDDIIAQAHAAAERLSEFYYRLHSAPETPGTNEHIRELISAGENAFWKHIADDFNTPRAIAEIFSLIKIINPLLDNGTLGTEENARMKKFLKDIDSVFRIIRKKDERIPDEIQRLASERELFRNEKRWKEADAVRDEMAKLGWTVKDTSGGPTIQRLG